MYKNYGDYNYLTWGGCLVDSEHSDTCFDIIYLRQYDDIEGQYIFCELSVDITDKWIDKKAVMQYIGMSEDDFDAIQYAIGCVDYYGPENFGALSCYSYDYRDVDIETIKDVLRHRLIANDNINIEW